MSLAARNPHTVGSAASISQAVPTAVNAGHYAGILIDLVKRRQVTDLGAQLAALATCGGDTSALVAAGRALLDTNGTGGRWPTLIPLGQGQHLPAFPG